MKDNLAHATGHDSRDYDTVLIACNRFTAEDALLRDECIALADAVGGKVLEVIEGKRRYVDSRYFFGRGFVERLTEAVQAHEPDVVLVNHVLQPAQQRNLEQTIGCRVCDRVGLILAIFAKRAYSHVGKLQVELAQLTHLSTRLVRGWTHLERQRGGIGLRGPGETQLELDRRQIAVRIRNIRKQLDKVHNQRRLARGLRARRRTPQIALVGYTNAGKSTLFRALTGADAFVADQLFATLDATIRKIRFTDGFEAVCCDTVGFIRALPHELVEAFQSTLDEVRQADLLVHVIDASDGQSAMLTAQVMTVLTQIDAADKPMITVMNKADKLTDGVLPIDTVAPDRLWLSATTGDGVAQLKAVLADRLRTLDMAMQH